MGIAAINKCNKCNQYLQSVIAALPISEAANPAIMACDDTLGFLQF
jgi:hypothetical protein